MRVGVFYFPADYGINIAELARALEDRGFDSLFVPEHTHIPLSRQVRPFPGGGELPKRYSHTHDPFVGARPSPRRRRRSSSSAPASAWCRSTTRSSPPSPSPASTSSRAAASSSASAAAGTSTRWRTTAPATTTASSMMRELRAGHEGAVDRGRGGLSRRVRRSSIRSGRGPSRAQRPHPPIILGGESDHTLRRVVDYCDGWFPRPRGGFDVVKAVDARLRQMASEKGRDPSHAVDHRVRRAQRAPRRWRATRRPASRARCWRSPTTAATRSCAISTRSRRSPGREVAA